MCVREKEIAYVRVFVKERLSVCVREREIEFVCVCVRERECICVCPYVRERERERERERKRLSWRMSFKSNCQHSLENTSKQRQQINKIPFR